MPTYEYRCDNCHHQFETLQSITARPLRKCPSCGKSKLRRLIGAGAAVIFKGSGFYQTDYRTESYSKAARAESAPTTSAAPESSKSGPKAVSDGAGKEKAGEKSGGKSSSQKKD